MYVTTTAAVLVASVRTTSKLAAEPSDTIDAPAVTEAVKVSSSSMVPVAVAVPRVTPEGSVVPVIVTVKVSSASASRSSAVDTVSVPVVSPAEIVSVPAVTAV